MTCEDDGAGHGPGTHLDAEDGGFFCDMVGGTVGPADTGDGVAGDFVLQCAASMAAVTAAAELEDSSPACSRRRPLVGEHLGLALGQVVQARASSSGASFATSSSKRS